MSSGEESNREEELAIVNLENVKRISETYKPSKGKGKNKKGKIAKAVVQEIWKDRLSPRFYSRLMSVMFPEESNEVSFLSFYTIYKNLAEPETEIMFRALTIYHIATIHEPPFNYEQANEYPNATYKSIKDYVCDVITSYLHAIIHVNMKEAHAWLDLRASNTLIDGNLVASYMLKDLETHRNEVSIGSLEIWLEKNEMYYTVSEQLYLFLFGVNTHANVKPLIPLPVLQTGRSTKTLLALPDVLLLNSKLPKRAQRWTLAYMLDSRSQNWETLRHAIYGKGQTIIVIQDANGDVFGMYGSHKWFPAEGFFGNGECFLFTLKPDVNIYERSGRDNNFQLFTESGIGMGGTADRPGLFIQSDTVKGSTSLACSTFREFWPLATELEFKITRIEIWAVDDEKVQAEVEQDVGKLIANTQYMKMKGDEIRNDKIMVEQPRCEQPRDVPFIENTSEMPTVSMSGPLRCRGECAMYAQQKRGPSYNQGRACCSKLCKKRSPRNPRGEGDGNADVQTAHRYPRQEEERRIYSEDKVKIKTENRHRRLSSDARQKHGAAGFIHPSLAAEENERNAREAKEAEAASLSPVVSKSNRTKTSKKQRLSPEQDLGQKSNSPTFTHNQVQVGESRLMKPTCRSYRHENKCACVVKKSCACTPKGTLPPSPDRAEKTYTYTIQTNHTTNEITLRSDECSSTKTAKTYRNMTTEKDSNSVRSYVYQSKQVKDFTAESSSTVLIEINNSHHDVKNEPMASSRRNSAVSEISKQSNKSEALPRLENEKPPKKLDQPTCEAGDKTEQMVPHVNSESNSKHARKEKVREGKDKHEDKPLTANSKQTLAQSKKTVQGNTNVSLQELMQAEFDCRCSSSTDCNDAKAEIKKCDPGSTCCCETKVSNYLTKMNRTDITGIPLSEISSSVCSCILDNKINNAAMSAGNSMNSSSKKETQNLTKSRRKSDASTRSVPVSYTPTKNPTKPKSLSSGSPNSSFASKKETHVLTKSRTVSRPSTFSSVYSTERPQPVPPTCLRCKTFVGKHGCQCKAKFVSNKATLIPLQTSHLLQKEVGKNTLALKNGGSRSAVIATEPMTVISGGTKLEHDAASITESLASIGNIRASSQSSQLKQAQKKSCKTSCKCSLSRSYFPVFPEDLIKEGGTSDDCDCASYNNLRFPVIVETPPDMSPQPSVKSPTPTELDKVDEQEDIQDKKCGCNDNDNTIIILNVSKCNTAETVEKIVQELEEKTGDASNPNFKNLVFKCKDFPEFRRSTLQHTPCTSKGGPEREALRQHIEGILKRKSHVTHPEQQQQS